MTSESALVNAPHRYAVRFCILLVGIYLCGMILNPEMEKVGQTGLLLWALGFLAWRPWRNSVLSAWDKALMLVFVGFFLVAVLSHLLNGGGYESGKMLGRYARFLLFIPLFFLFRRYASAALLFPVVMLVMAFNCAWAVVEYYGWGEMLVGDKMFRGPVNASLNPIQYGNLMLCLTIFLLSGQGVYRQKGKYWVVGMWVLGTLGLAAVFASDARGAMVGMPLLGLAAWVIGMRNRSSGLRPLILPLITLLAFLPSYQSVTERAQRGVAEAQSHEAMQEDAPTSVGTRLHMWRAATRIFLESPWFGAGLGSYEAKSQQLYERDEAHFFAVYSHPHSEYFSVLATRGLLGLASLGLLFLVPLLYFWRHVTEADLVPRAVACAGLMLVLELGQAALTESIFRLSSTMGFYIFSIACLSAILSTYAKKPTSE